MDSAALPLCCLLRGRRAGKSFRSDLTLKQNALHLFGAILEQSPGNAAYLCFLFVEKALPRTRARIILWTKKIAPET
jgi:hypothetical protein